MLSDDLDAILTRLGHEDVSIRERTIQELGVYAHRADGEAENESLEQWGKGLVQRLQDRRIVDALLIAMNDVSTRVRAFAALFLGQGEIREGQDALILHLLNDPSDQVRMMCVTSLGHMPESPQKLHALLDALQDMQDQVVYPACQILGKIGDPVAIEPLRTVLDHPSWHVRFRACEALVRLNAVDQKVVNLLEELDRQPEAEWQNRTVEEIRKDKAIDSSQSLTDKLRPHTTVELIQIARNALQ